MRGIIKKHGIPGDYELQKLLYLQVKYLLDLALPSNILSAERKSKVFNIMFTTIYKLGAIKYHRDRFVKEWKRRIRNIKKDAEVIQEESVLAYEFEAYMFQIKSCLDTLVKILDPLVNIRLSTYGNVGDRVIKALSNNLSDQYKLRADYLKHLIQENSKWLKLLIEIRDKLYHYSQEDKSMQHFFFSVQTTRDGGKRIISPRVFGKYDAIGMVTFSWQRIFVFARDFLAFSIYIVLPPFCGEPVLTAEGVWLPKFRITKNQPQNKDPQ